jgi:hypothetical protein
MASLAWLVFAARTVQMLLVIDREGSCSPPLIPKASQNIDLILYGIKDSKGIRRRTIVNFRSSL